MEQLFGAFELFYIFTIIYLDQMLKTFFKKRRPEELPGQEIRNILNGETEFVVTQIFHHLCPLSWSVQSQLVLSVIFCTSQNHSWHQIIFVFVGEEQVWTLSNQKCSTWSNPAKALLTMSLQGFSFQLHVILHFIIVLIAHITSVWFKIISSLKQERVLIIKHKALYKFKDALWKATALVTSCTFWFSSKQGNKRKGCSQQIRWNKCVQSLLLGCSISALGK